MAKKIYKDISVDIDLDTSELDELEIDADDIVAPPKPRGTRRPPKRKETLNAKLRRTPDPAEKKALRVKHKLTAAKANLTRQENLLKNLIEETPEAVAAVVSDRYESSAGQVLEKVLEDQVRIMPNPGPQTQFLASDEDEVFYGGARGGGKGGSYLTEIITLFGRKKLGDLKVGDSILNPDGTPQKVLQIHELGERDLYKFTFEDGRVTSVTEDHLWLIHKSSSRSKKESYTEGYAKGELWTTAMIYDWLNSKEEAKEEKTINKQNLSVPLCKPLPQTVSYKYNPRTIDPYILGALIGDGCMTKAISLASADDEIIDYFKGYFGGDFTKSEGTISHRIRLHPLKEQLEKLELFGKTAERKFIPECYKNASLDDRWQLIRGLMDTDGTIDSRGHMSFTSISEQLAKDVQKVCWSLGAKGNITQRIPTYSYRGQILEGQLAYTVQIQHPRPELFFNLTRKKERAQEYKYNGGVGSSELRLRIRSVVKEGRDKCRCIVVSNPNRLYMQDDFIVTHNTYALILDPLRYINHPRFTGLLIRRTVPELQDIIAQQQVIYKAVDPRCRFLKQEKLWEFSSGARLFLGYGETTDDLERYRGHSYQWLGMDELPQYPTAAEFNLLKSSVRSPYPDLPTRIRCCVDEGEVLTEHGWKDIRAIQVGELVWSVRPDNISELKPVTGLYEYEVDEELVRYAHKGTYISMAEDHRILYRDTDGSNKIARYNELTNKQIKFVRQTNFNLVSRYENPFGWADEVFFSFLGIYIAEGHCRHRYSKPNQNPSEVGLCQYKEKERKEVLDLLERTGLNWKEYRTGEFAVSSRQLYDFLEPLGQAKTKFIPREIIEGASREQLELLFNWYMKGDGHWQTPSNVEGYTASEQLSLDIAEIALKLGYRTKINQRDRVTNFAKGTSWVVTCTKKAVDTHTIEKKYEKRVPYKGKIYCISVQDNETFILKQKGFQWVSSNTGNPGNVGSGWVKEMFIDPAPPNQAHKVDVSFKNPLTNEIQKAVITRKFIPARVWDNPTLLNDANYVATLASLPETMRKQMLDGDWDVSDGMAFSEFKRDIHVCDPFPVPYEWPRIRGADWGYSSPFAVYWIAFDHDNTAYVYREFYGKGVLADKWAEKVCDLEKEEAGLINYGIIDRSTASNRGDTGPTIYETVFKITRDRGHAIWRYADQSPNSRKQRKMELHYRLSSRPTGKERRKYKVDGVETEEKAVDKPRLVIFSSCVNLIRTLPMLPLEKNDPELVDTNAEDHAYDALTYALMSRPISVEQNISNKLFMQTPNNFNPTDSVFGY